MKALLVTLIACLVVSCGNPFGANPKGYITNNEDLDSAWKKSSSYTYIYDYTNYWKSPIEFENDGGGDCEDFAAYLVYLLGPTSELVLIGENNTNCHAIVKYENKYIEPQVYGKYLNDPKILVIFDYYTIMKYCTNSGTKSL